MAQGRKATGAPTVSAEDQRLQRQIAAAQGAIGHLVTDSDTLAALARVNWVERGLRDARYGGLASVISQKAIDELRGIQGLIAGGSVNESYRSPTRDGLDALTAPRRLPKTRAISAPVDTTARAPATIESVAAIGKRVRAARRAMGMTQQRFADLAGVGRRFVIELEQGKETLEIGRVLKVCKAAGITLLIAE